MKNVKVILVGVALCATVFANQRIDALGGDSGFWPGDKDNINTFPSAVNDHGFVEVDGVGTAGGEGDISATIVWGDNTKWGFSFDEAKKNHWFDIMWGSGDMGIRAALLSSTPQSYNDDTTLDDESEGVTGFEIAYGQNFSWGELGVSLTTVDDATSYGVNWRGDLGFWAFDTAKAGMNMSDDGMETTTMNIDFDMFTHMDAGGADVLFGLGFGYESWNLAATTVDVVDDMDTPDDTSDDITTTHPVYESAVTRMTLPSATLAVEADMTDWATFRCFVNTNYSVAVTNDDPVADYNYEAPDVNEDGIDDYDAMERDLGSGLVDGYTGSSVTYGFGLGFNWGGLTADLHISENVLQDPVSYMTGYEDNTLTSAGVTLTYSF
jgi:hypothetical protein